MVQRADRRCDVTGVDVRAAAGSGESLRRRRRGDADVRSGIGRNADIERQQLPVFEAFEQRAEAAQRLSPYEPAAKAAEEVPHGWVTYWLQRWALAWRPEPHPRI